MRRIRMRRRRRSSVINSDTGVMQIMPTSSTNCFGDDQSIFVQIDKVDATSWVTVLTLMEKGTPERPGEIKNR